MFNDRELRAFLAVVDAGTVSAASEALFLTQPTLSRQIAGLESQIGAALFRRTPHGMTPTAAGIRLEPLARDLVKRGERAESIMRGIASQAQTFTVACPETTANGFVAPFMAAGGAVRDVRTVTPRDVYDQLRLGIDIGVSTSEPPSQLRSQSLCALGIRYMVRSDHPLASQSSVELRAVASSLAIVPGRGSAVFRILTEVSEASGVALDAQLATNGTLAQARTAATGIPSLVVEEPHFGLHGIRLLHEGKQLLVPFYAAWERSQYDDAPIRDTVGKLRDFMRERIVVLGLQIDP